MALPGVLGTILVLIFRNPKPGLFIAKYVFCAGLFPLMFSRLSIYGRENVDWKRPHLFISNHESLIDIPAVFLASRRYLFFLTKMELKHTPFVGWLGQASGMIFIDRKDSEAAAKSIDNASKEIKRGKNVISFAEGTRSKSGEIAQFKKGSFKIALNDATPIIPIFISGAREILPSGSMRLRPGHVKVFIGEEIKTDSFAKDKPEVLADYVREKIVEMKVKNQAN